MVCCSLIMVSFSTQHSMVLSNAITKRLHFLNHEINLIVSVWCAVYSQLDDDFFQYSLPLS